MFKNPFSFNGRIRRTEYALSVIFYIVSYFLVLLIITSFAGEETGALYLLLLIPALWFLWAQGAKRCHDLGKSGWFQLIPFYGFLMLFADGEKGDNKYGEDAKESLVTA